MKVCVFGAGAVGGYLAAQLGKAPGVELFIVARGANLKAIQDNGIRVQSKDGQWSARPVAATDKPETLPPQDIVFVTLKSTAQAGSAAAIAALLAPDGHVVFVNNGIPWWWNHGLPNAGDAGPLPLLDEGGALWNLLPARTLGCVVYSANEVVAPGVVQHNGNNRWVIGEPDNSSSERVQRTVATMLAGGLGAEASTDMRREVFAKLMRNAAFNTICALTGLPVEWLTEDPSLKALVGAVIGEMKAIAAALGIDASEAAEAARRFKKRPEGMTLEQGQKPSMLQDAIARRPMEVEAILGQVCEFATQTGTPCPSARTLLALLRGLDARMKLGA
ncbi:MAG: 2-dehydropantoate 2-reductase [Pseudomonadota bacterium]